MNTYRAGGYTYKESDLGSANHLGNFALQPLEIEFDNSIDASLYTNAR